jgi:hypothetical protein
LKVHERLENHLLEHFSESLVVGKTFDTGRHYHVSYRRMDGLVYAGSAHGLSSGRNEQRHFVGVGNRLSHHPERQHGTGCFHCHRAGVGNIIENYPYLPLFALFRFSDHVRYGNHAGIIKDCSGVIPQGDIPLGKMLAISLELDHELELCRLGALSHVVVPHLRERCPQE